GLNQASDIRVIAREARNGFTAHQVEAAIPDVREVEAEIVEGNRSASGAHALQFRMGISVLADAFVSLAETGDQRVLKIARGIVIVNITNGIDREATGFLPTFVATHAVGDQRQPALSLELVVALGLPVRQCVFVILALATHIAQAGHFDSGPNLHHASLERMQRVNAPSFQTVDRLSPRSPRLSRTPHPIKPDGLDDYKA